MFDLRIGLDSPFGYAETAAFAFLESQADPAALDAARRDARAAGFVAKRGFPRYPNFVEGFPGVACEDTTNPTGGHGEWFAAGQAATAEFGIFGEPWAWASGPCAAWASVDDDAYKGSFARARPRRCS